MSEEILKIKTKKYKEESVIVSVRVPKDMLRDIDLISKESGRTRNEILTRLLDFGLKHTEIIDD
ncbi:MAG: ribbon-helix-helix protein, CopG family [Lachnospiraceae bacterium]|nr:ribbon-helix-helix protein, CopG family [Lachnospiraceae bacterium]